VPTKARRLVCQSQGTVGPEQSNSSSFSERRNRRRAKDFEKPSGGLPVRSALHLTKVGKSDCEGTFAQASGNDEDAP